VNKRFFQLTCAIAAAILVALSGTVATAQQKQDQFVLLRTTRGSILMRVYYSMVPYTAGNFLDLVNRGFYDGLTFHRVEDWVVQGGDPNGTGTGNYVDPETGNTRYLKLQVDSRLTHNQTGMVAMARSASPNSASCQFYILKRPMPQLNGKYAVFGKVIKGINTVGIIGRGDQILSARIVDPDTLQPVGSGGGGGDGGGSGGTQQAVPGVAEPTPKQLPPSPTGDAGF
jgi:peptidyl-prolyl cis-trans isomerase B (cyclophilin B)